MTVWASPTSAPIPTRLGLTVPAAAGGAVPRNRLRRRLREIVSAYRPPDGFDVVIRAEAGATGRNFQELREIVGTALDHAGVRTGT